MTVLLTFVTTTLMYGVLAFFAGNWLLQKYNEQPDRMKAAYHVIVELVKKKG
jgi:hypothetical protein